MLDETLPANVAGETRFGSRVVAINPNYISSLNKTALHEIGHTLLLNDVSAESCAGLTTMFETIGGNPGDVTSADVCTIDHVYRIRDESPLILNLEPGYPELTGPEVLFDLTNCGSPQLLGWTTADSRAGFLVLDRNGDGKITSGAEMFGNYTPFPTPLGYLPTNGFQVLAAFDDPGMGGDGDGWITPKDRIYSSLRLWIDANHDGVSEPWELGALDELGIVGISLSVRESPKRDRFGNQMRYVASFRLRLSSGELVQRRVVDVFVVHQ
jgi:hypothetical protein